MNNVIESRLALRQESGQTLPLIALFMVVLLVMCGIVIDLGNAYRVQQQLQASADAAATAGAGQLSMTYPPIAGNAITTAQAYGSEPGGKNPITGVPAAGVTESASTSCVTQTTFRCVNANTVSVNESAQVPTNFLGLIGVKTITVSVHSQACSPCGTLPLDIQLVVDRTGSMSEMGGSTNGLDKLENLKQGLLQGFLPTLDPSEDYVGLTLLPPDKAGTTDVCAAQNAQSYNISTPTYTVVPLSNNYMDMQGNLIQNSPLVSDINCLQAGGSTDYANALEAADAELIKDGRPGVQKVIVLLSDGAANTGQNCKANPSDPHCTQPCHTAVSDASTYKSQGVLVYTVLYGDQSGGPACQTSTGANESPAMQPWDAMTQIATPGNYFPDPNPANLQNVFQKISMDMGAGSSRLTQ
jgi:Flp pilus assembly protein TadG